MSHIFNHNRFPFDTTIDRREYWDFFLGLSTAYTMHDSDSLAKECLSAYIDTSDDECIDDKNLISKKDYKWEDIKNEGVNFENIGYTGVDNGFITFDKYTITNKEFIELFTESTYAIDKEDNKLHLNKVDGNNQLFTYDNEFVTDNEKGRVAKLNGGFFQGFFRSGCGYQILPSNLGYGWCLEFTLKKEDFEKKGYTLNDRYPENKGTFFYMGTRAENKWWEKFNVSETFARIYNTYFADDYIEDDYLKTIDPNEEYFADNKPVTYSDDDYFNDEYFNTVCKGKCTPYDEEHHEGCKYKFKYPEALNCYQSNSKWFNDCGGVWIETELLKTGSENGSNRNKYKCDCSKYFNDGYFADDIEICDCDTDYVRKDYRGHDEYLDVDRDLETKDGYSVGQPNIVEIRTDNKFILFDRTCDGFTVDNWVDGSEVIITDIKDNGKENYFLLFNRTCGGKTVESEIEPNKDYDVCADLYRNAFALQIDDEGKLGYKYLVKDCDTDEESECHIKILSEFTKKPVITQSQWHTISVRFRPLGKIYKKNDKKTSDSVKMLLMIYVDGKLRLISKELPTFNFRELNDLPSKQEGVPFNISLGGGTQGLSDVIYYNYLEYPKYRLPLEKHFGGTFIGYIKSFRFYDCDKSLGEIRQNYRYEKSLRH